MRIGALILAGGRSTRMGRSKELLPFRGVTLLQRACTAAAHAGCAPVVVVGRSTDQQLPPLPGEVAFATDARPDQGPLQGLATGLLHLRDQHGFTAGDAAFTTAVDMPFVGPDDVRWLVERLGSATVLMPEVAARPQPLFAVYRLAVLDAALLLLARGERALHTVSRVPGARLVGEAELRRHDPALRLLQDVDTPADYARLEPKAEP